ncbi:uncharacterized protein LOC126682764 [Mercurialis annua]|uniref:uncharacterized protein LOC126682764 n=1 Tax=Mercurialis annua TaxID=3986 RepID=UPI00215DD5F2|nr:uncharacterized protein LOC126682764 [Mercurialis annua]
MLIHFISRRFMMVAMTVATAIIAAEGADNNDVFSPCLDATVQIADGFTFGIVFSSRDSFFFDQVQLSPCDTRLGLSGKTAQLAVYRPKVDEISLLTINGTTFDPTMSGGYMVAFAGRKYAARSLPVTVAENNMIVTSFTLVLEFQKGILQNLFWKSFGCGSCSGDFVCLNGKDCAIQNSKCRNLGGPIDCNLGIQLAFSGTDKNLESLNTWYEVSNLRQYSLYGLYSDIQNSIGQVTGQL